MKILKILSLNNLSGQSQILLTCSALLIFLLINIVDFKDFKAQVSISSWASLITDAQDVWVDDEIDVSLVDNDNDTLTNLQPEIVKEISDTQDEKPEMQDAPEDIQVESPDANPENIDNVDIGYETIETPEFSQPVLVENPVLLENIENIDLNSETWASNENSNSELSHVNESLEDFYKSNEQVEVISNTQVDEEKKQEYLLNQDAQIVEVQDANLETNEDNLDTKIEEVVEKIISQNTVSNNDIPEDDFDVSWDNILNFNNKVREDKYQNEIWLQNQKIIQLEEDRLSLEKKLESLEEILSEKKYLSSQLLTTQTQGNISKSEIANLELERNAQEKRIKQEQQATQRQINLIASSKFRNDTDWDWLSDNIEKQIWTNYKLIDSDFDWYSDLTEIEKWLNPIWDGDLFIDFEWMNSRTQAVIKAIKKSLVFLRVWDLFAFNEEIFRDEALKIIITAMYPNEIYLDNMSFSWVFIFDDIDEDDFLSVRTIQIAQNHNLLDWIIADKFGPYSTFSKAEFVKILVQATWKPLTKERRKWRDTDYDNWFAPYFSTAAEIWIISIPSSARIQPLRPVTRIEALRMVLDAI